MRQLAHRLASGDRNAFTELYDLCGDRMHLFLVSKRMPREDASDLIQEVFLRLVRKKEAFQSVENPAAFAFQVARNEANRWLSRTIRKREQFRLIAADLFVEVDPNHSKSEDWRDTFTNALAVLPDEQREVVVLKIYSGFTFQEIAVITATPQGTVATRFRRGIGQICQELPWSWWRSFRSGYLTSMQKGIDLARKPYKDFRADHAADKSLFDSMVGPALEAAREATARNQALSRALRVLNAIQSAPNWMAADQIDALQLGLPADATKDPFTEQPLVIRKQGSGWLIYSVGFNLKDDGGEIDESKDVGVAPYK